MSASLMEGQHKSSRAFERKQKQAARTRRVWSPRTAKGAKLWNLIGGFLRPEDLSRCLQLDSTVNTYVKNTVRAYHLSLNDLSYQYLQRSDWFGGFMQRSVAHLRTLRLWGSSGGQLSELATRLLLSGMSHLQTCVLCVDLIPNMALVADRIRPRTPKDWKKTGEKPVLTVFLPNLRHLDLIECTFPSDLTIQFDANELTSIAIKMENIKKINHRIVTHILPIYGNTIDEESSEPVIMTMMSSDRYVLIRLGDAMSAVSTLPGAEDCVNGLTELVSVDSAKPDLYSPALVPVVKYSNWEKHSSGKTGSIVNRLTDESRLFAPDFALSVTRYSSSIMSGVSVTHQGNGRNGLTVHCPRFVSLESHPTRSAREQNLKEVLTYGALRRTEDIPQVVDRTLLQHGTGVEVDMLMHSANKNWKALESLQDIPDWIDMVPMPYKPVDKGMVRAEAWTPPASLSFNMHGAVERPTIVDPDRNAQKLVLLEIYWKSQAHMETMYQIMQRDDPVHARCLVTIVVDEFEPWLLTMDWHQLVEEHHIFFLYFRYKVPTLSQMLGLYIKFQELRVAFPRATHPALGCAGIPFVPPAYTEFVYQLLTGNYEANGLEHLIQLVRPKARKQILQLQQKRNFRYRSALQKELSKDLAWPECRPITRGSLSAVQMEKFTSFYRRVESSLPRNRLDIGDGLNAPQRDWICPSTSPWYLEHLVAGNFQALREWGITTYRVPFCTYSAAAPLKKWPCETSDIFWLEYLEECDAKSRFDAQRLSNHFKLKPLLKVVKVTKEFARNKARKAEAARDSRKRRSPLDWVESEAGQTKELTQRKTYPSEGVVPFKAAIARDYLSRDYVHP